MKKGMICIMIITLILGLWIGLSGAEGTVLSREDEVLALLYQARKEELTSIKFECTASLSKTLAANEYRELRILEAQAGITRARNNRYTDTTFSLFGLTYGTVAFARCSSESEVRAALQDCAAAKADQFLLAVTSDLIGHLTGNDLLLNLMAQVGMNSSKVRIFPDETASLISSNHIDWLTIPFAVVGDEDSFYSAIEAFQKAEEDQFMLVYTLDYMQQLKKDSEQLALMEFTSKMDNWASIFSIPWMKKYHSVTYTDIPKIICHSSEEIVSALKRMGAEGMKEFDLVLPSALYQELSADHFAALAPLEKEAEVQSKKLKIYFGGQHVLRYCETEFGR